MKVEFPHRVRYTAKNITVEDLIDALEAQKAILHVATEVLEAIDPNFKSDNAVIRINHVQTSSLLIDLLIEIYGAYQDNVENRVVGAIEALLGVEVPEEYRALVTLLALAVVYWVARSVYENVTRKENKLAPPSTNLTGEMNVVINILAEKLQLDAADIERAIGRSLPEKKLHRLINPVRRFFKPAKNNPGSAIEYPDVKKLTTSPEAVAEFPSDAQIASVTDVEMRNVENVVLEIRATDLDRTNTGWAGRIVGRKAFKGRLPMDLYPTIDAKALALERRVRADVIVEIVVSEDGSEKPRRIHLIQYRKHE